MYAKTRGAHKVKPASKPRLYFLYPIDQQADKALFSPGERYFTSALRFYVGEVSAAGNGWLMHRQSAVRLGMLHVRRGAAGKGSRDLGPLGAQHGGLSTEVVVASAIHLCCSS